MRNLTIKKVALGLVLAGYAASGAFALTASTQKTITGRAPLVNALSLSSTNLTDNSVDITVYKADGTTVLTASDSWATGNIVKLNWKTVDADGDSESSAYETGVTIKFGYLKGTTWTYSGALTPSAAGEVKWTIPTAALGATKIGYVIRPTTQFGDPSQNNWVKGYIDNNTATGDGGDSTTSTDPSGTDGTGGGTSGTGTGPVKPSSDTYTIDIYEATITAGAITYGSTSLSATGSTTVPTVGKTYAVKVMDTSQSPAADATSTFDYNWTLDGTAFTVAALTTPLTPVASTTIANVAHKIDVNSTYDSSYKAGAQGFKLTVTTK